MTHAVGRYDGHYSGTVGLQSVGSFKSQVEIKLIDSAFKFKTSYSAESEQFKGLAGRMELDVTGNVSEEGQVNGNVIGFGESTGNGQMIAKWDIKTTLAGTVKDGEMHWTSQGVPVNVVCPKGVKCNTDDVTYTIEANLTRTMTSEGGFIHQSEDDDYRERIDQSEPIIEKIMGEVETSDTTKRAPFQAILNEFWQGKIDITGKPIDHSRVWEEGRSGVPLKDDDEIKTGNGRVILKFPDGTKFIVMENTTLIKTPDGFKVEKGGVYMDFWKIGNKVRIMTKRGSGFITGTKLAVLESEEKTILELYEGSVEFQREGKTTKVEPGSAITVTNQGFAPIRQIDSPTLIAGWQTTAAKIEKEAKDDLLNRPEMLLVVVFGLGILFILGIILVIKRKLFGLILVIMPIAVITYFFASQQKNTTQDSLPLTENDTSHKIPNSEQAILVVSPANSPATKPDTSGQAPSTTWETYTHPTMGFTIKHPQNIKPENYNDETFVLSLWGPKQTADTEFFDGIDISIQKKSLDGKTLTAVVEENRTGSAEIAGETISPAFPAGLGGISGMAYTAMDNDYYFIPLKSGYYFEILDLSADPGNIGYQKTATKILESMVISQ